MVEAASWPKRIAVVSDSLPPLGNGGIGNSHFNLLKSFKRLGYEVKAFTYYDPQKISGESDIVRKGFPRWLEKVAKRLAALLYEIHGILVLKTYPIGRVVESVVAFFGALNGLRLIFPVLRFHPDVIIVPDRGAVGAFWPKSLLKKTLVIAHSNPLRFINQPLIGMYSVLDAKLAVSLEQKMIRWCAAAICPSRYMVDVFKKSYSFNGTIAQIPNLIDEETLAKVEPQAFSERPGFKKAVKIYIPAASNPNKGRQFTFEIVRRLAAGLGKSEIYFYLSGAIDAENEILLRHVPKNAFVFAPGSISYQENISYFKACDFCLSPTLIENFGMALLEAVFCGLPVVSFDIGGNRDLVLHGRTGYLVPYLDMEALLEASTLLIKRPNQRKAMGRASRRFAQNNFSGSVVEGQFRKLFGALHAKL